MSKMEKLTSNNLKEILDKHKKWMEDEPDGECADLTGADLCDVDFHYVDLYRANLRHTHLCGADLSSSTLRYADLTDANLCGANLYNADLHGASLRGANLSGANLCGATLSHASLFGANLFGADLSGADLYCADLYCANLVGINPSGANFSHVDLRGAKIETPLLNKILPIACPEAGSFIGWKKCRNGLIVKLEICEDAKRLSALKRECRCSKARVVEICDIDGTTQYTEAISVYDRDFVYKLGEIVEVEDFDEDRHHDCSKGIHFFITRQEAVDYDVS